MQARLDAAASKLVDIALYDGEKLAEFANHCTDLGLEVPEVILKDKRYTSLG